MQAIFLCPKKWLWFKNRIETLAHPPQDCSTALVFQGVERTAVKFFHPNNYGAISAPVSLFIAHEFPTLAGYFALLLFMIIARGFVAAFILTWKKPLKSTFQ